VTGPLLSIEDLRVQYGIGATAVPAVRGVSMHLNPGEIVGLAGESGCGKSTLAYGACRLLPPPGLITGGQVIYRGRRAAGQAVDLLAATPGQLRELRWSEISIVFQSAMHSLNPVLSVRAQLNDVLVAHTGLRRAARESRARELLDLVGIPAGRLASYPHELSGGMRQRVMIAMALALEPEVVIMDEPTTALDVVVQRAILEQVAALQQEFGFAVLFITHDLSLLLEMADRIAIMYAGRIVEEASAAAIRSSPAHPYTRALLGSFPALRGPQRELAGIGGSPPDPRRLPPGCPFEPRCSAAIGRCQHERPALAYRSGSGRRAACLLTSGPVTSGPVTSEASTSEPVTTPPVTTPSLATEPGSER
jgi:peptide/nickel transport system ATP-binding protein